MPGGHPTHYGGADPVLPPYSQVPGDFGRSDQETGDYYCQQDSSSFRRERKITWCFVVTFFLLMLHVVVDIYFSDISTKISMWNEARARYREDADAMNREARHLEHERLAHRDESTRLEKERMSLDSSTVRMEGQKLALEATIRHSEQERLKFEQEKRLLDGARSTFEKEKHLLENERKSLEREEFSLKEERERWEKARDEQTIPQGAFWEVVWPAWDCRAYGQREYWGILRNIPAGRSEIDACMNMPVEIRGVTIRRPYRCQHIQGSIRGFWMVDWDQPDCKPWHQDFVDRVSLGNRIVV